MGIARRSHRRAPTPRTGARIACWSPLDCYLTSCHHRIAVVLPAAAQRWPAGMASSATVISVTFMLLSLALCSRSAPAMSWSGRVG